MRITLIIPFVFLVGLFSSCSIKYLYNSQQYEAAISRGVLKLNRIPNDFETYNFLHNSYDEFEEAQLLKIESLEEGKSPNWEEVRKAYLEIKRIQDYLEDLKYEQSKKEIINFENIIKETEQKITQEAIGYANSILESKSSKQQFQAAFRKLEKAKQLNSENPEIDSLLVKTKQKGTTHIVFSYENPNNYDFPETFYENLNSIELTDYNDEWTKYHPVYERGMQYDFNLKIKFYHFYLKDKELNKLTYKDTKEVTSQYGEIEKVEAKVTTKRNYKSIYLKGDLQLIDNEAMNTFKMYPLMAYENWQVERASFEGDRRALSVNSEMKIYEGEDELSDYLNCLL